MELSDVSPWAQAAARADAAVARLDDAPNGIEAEQDEARLRHTE